MKKLIISILFISICVINKAQCNLPYKSLSAFGTDTTAFIIYNFMDRADCYKGKTIKEVEKDLQIPIVDYVNIVGGGFAGLCLYMHNLDEMDNIRNNAIDYNICINWESNIDTDSPGFNTYQKNNAKVNNTQSRWKSIDYSFIKDLKISNIYVEIPNKSKYYEKYKEQVKKSRKKRTLRFTF